MIEYILSKVPGLVKFSLIFFLTCFTISKCTKHEPEDLKPYFNLDENKNVWDIAELDYATGEVTYRQYGNPPKAKYIRSYTKEDIIHHMNVEIEDLIDYHGI